MSAVRRSDSELLDAVADRDLAAMRELYDRHAPRCGRNPGPFRGQGVVGARLWGIAIRRLVSRLRGRRDVILDGDLGQAMAQLSPQLRSVVHAVILDGLTTREAARLLDIGACVLAIAAVARSERCYRP